MDELLREICSACNDLIQLHAIGSDEHVQEQALSTAEGLVKAAMLLRLEFEGPHNAGEDLLLDAFFEALRHRHPDDRLGPGTESILHLPGRLEDDGITPCMDVTVTFEVVAGKTMDPGRKEQAQ